MTDPYEISNPIGIRQPDGSVTVEGAGRFIRVSHEFAKALVVDDVLALDTAREHLYRFLQFDGDQALIFERIEDTP